MTGPEHHREAERLLELAREAGIQRAPIPIPTRFNIGAPDLPDIPDYGKFYATSPPIRSAATSWPTPRYAHCSP